MAQPKLHTYFQSRSAGLSPKPSRQAHEKPLQKQELLPFSASGLSTQLLPLCESVSGAGVLDGINNSHTCRVVLARPLDLRAQISTIESSHIPAIKRLTSSTLPVHYPEKFFGDTIRDRHVADLSRVLLYDEKPVGWIRCRLEPSPAGPQRTSVNQIYIQALCVLAPYRNCGYASHLLGSVLDTENLTKYNATFVYAHVWENNEDALLWYDKRNFQRTILIDQYYRKLKPGGAWIVKRDLHSA